MAMALQSRQVLWAAPQGAGQQGRFQVGMPLANTVPNGRAGGFIRNVIRKHSHREGELLMNCLDARGEAVPFAVQKNQHHTGRGEHHHGAGTPVGVNPAQGGDQ